MRHVFRPRAARAVSLLLSVSVFALDAKAANPPCFTSKTENAVASGAAAAAAVSVGAAATSTNQALELVAERREEQTQSCPSGYFLVNGACQPVATVVADSETLPEPAAETVEADAAPAESQSSGGSGSGGSGASGGGSSAGTAKAAKTMTSKPKPVSQSASAGDVAPSGSYADVRPDAPEGPSQMGFEVWGEGFGEYEELEGLKIGKATGIRRDQKVRGFLSGIDKTFQTSSDGGIVLGVLGGASRSDQKFTTASERQIQATTYRLEPEFPTTDLDGRPVRAVFDFDRPHELTTSVEQTQDGGSAALYASAYKGGFFFDGLFKVDFMEVRRTSEVTDRFDRTITGFTLSTARPSNVLPAQGIARDADGNSCIISQLNPGDQSQVGDIRQSGIRFENPQTTTTTVVEKANFENYILAGNVGYRADLDQASGLWWEPSGSLTYVHTDFGEDGAKMGFDDGDTLRLQGGARIGVTRLHEPGRMFWTVAAGAYAYSDVLVDGFVKEGNGIPISSFDSEEGKLRALGVLQLNLDWIDGYSLYVEGQARGGEDLWAVGGKVGGRLAW